MLKFATQNNNDYDNMTMQEIHENLNIELINIRLYKLANRAWNRFSQINPNLANKSLDLNNNPNERDHNWWLRIASFVSNPESSGKHVRTDY